MDIFFSSYENLTRRNRNEGKIRKKKKLRGVDCGERNKGLEKLKFKGWNESVKEGGGEGNLKKEKGDVFGHGKRNSNDKKRVTQEWGDKEFQRWKKNGTMALKIKKKRDSSSGKKKEGIANVASHWSFKFVVCEFLPISRICWHFDHANLFSDDGDFTISLYRESCHKDRLSNRNRGELCARQADFIVHRS